MADAVVPRDIIVAYESGQMFRGVRLAAPVLVFVLLAWPVALDAQRVLVFGTVLFTVAVALGWWGRAVGKGVLPGLLLGALPFASALLAQQIGHVCTSEGCYSLCAPLCAGAGAVAGFALSRWFFMGRSRGRLLSWLVASGFVIAVGALGCSCLGAGSLVGVALGQLLGSGAAYMRRRASV